MRVRAFEGNSGDCILITSNEGRNILVDGGLVRRLFGTVLSYQFNVAPELTKLRDNGQKLDLVCVSHVDQDHIGGILAMLDDEFAWRVHDHQRAQGLDPDEPGGPRPPEIERIWHNAFQDQIGKDSGDLHTALQIASAHVIATGAGPSSHGNDLFGQLATSLQEAAKVSRRIGASQLGIPLNPEFNGKLVRRHNQSVPIDIGDLTITVLGPTSKRLGELKEKWQEWLRSAKGRRQIAAVREDAAENEQLLLSEGLAALFALSDLGPSVGNRESVTAQNVSSIVMMVGENGKTVLLTGDARDDDIYDDLVATGFTNSDGHAHVDVLKVQHHGSENNWSLGFGQKVTADHYLFCGNGGHHNPDLRVIQRVLDARVGSASKRSPHVDPRRPFTLWFTSDGTTFKADKLHMKKVRDLVESRMADHDHASFYFSDQPFFDIQV